jgi:hypothetical protein
LTVLASVPMNAEGGSYMTMGGPLVLFAIVGTILWLRLFRPHRRVPARRALAGATTAASDGLGAQATQVTTAGSVSGAAPDATGGATAAGSAPAQPEQDTPTDGTEASE